MLKRVTIGLCCAVFLVCGIVFADGWNYPPLPTPSEYGDLVINRLSEKKGVRAVSFSHWSHRRTATCRVCHLELEFAMKVNETRITEKAHQDRDFCGACHDGVSSFPHIEENCDKCHNDGVSNMKDAYFQEMKKFPRGNGDFIDWSESLRTGLISPKRSIQDENYSPPPITKTLILESDWNYVPPAYFPHKEHTEWLDCAQCHPYLFNIKKKSTEHFSMEYINEGEFCGVCHLNVAFPIHDCVRCHPDMKRSKL
jgi:c(7)-type cytochrome triheme protein